VAGRGRRINHLPGGPGSGEAQGSRAGCVWVNQHFTLVNEMPHGGRQMSGDGKDVSVYGLEDYTVVRHVMVNFG
jgi:aminobutyraldehyde dehydrogenase